MADNWTKDQTRTLINLYQQCECLYDVKHADYLKRNKRSEKMIFIQNQLKSIKPDVTVASIKTKIRTLTNQLSKERQKMRNSTRSGAGTADIYTPKLWCFKELEFLFHLKDEKIGITNIDFLEEDYNGNVSAVPEEPDETEEAEEAIEVQVSKKPKHNQEAQELRSRAEKTLNLVDRFLNNQNVKSKEDKFGEFLAAELKSLKLVETFDELKIDILQLVNKAKEKENLKILKKTQQDASLDWREKLSASSTPISFIMGTSNSNSRSSSPGSYLEYKQFDRQCKGNTKINVQKVQVVKAANSHLMESPDILPMAIANLFEEE